MCEGGFEDRYSTRHPTVKPVDLISWLVKLVVPPKGLFLDPFAGSGTAAIAALRTRRDAILIEREEQYVKDIRERVETFKELPPHAVPSRHDAATYDREEAVLMASLLDAYGLLQAGAEALAVIERNGIGVDVPYCQSKVVWLDGKIDQAKRRLERTELTTAWRRRFGDKADYGSPGQLRAVLYADLGVKPFKRTAGGDDGIRRGIPAPGRSPRHRQLADPARRYKKARDVLSGFLRYQVNGRMHPSFPLHTVATYRSSSVSPNCQNVPKRNKEIMDICRRAIVPLPGHVILEIDGKGMEVSISACHHKDPRMIAYLNDPSSDMHADMAQQIFKRPNYNRRPDGFGTLRQAAKNGFVFPEFYGDDFETCANNMACSWLKMPAHRPLASRAGGRVRGATDRPAPPRQRLRVPPRLHRSRAGRRGRLLGKALQGI